MKNFLTVTVAIGMQYLKGKTQYLTFMLLAIGAVSIFWLVSSSETILKPN